ncbi:MAG: heme exporter protein CcmD [Albidovulum sp.]|nr:heme exporter protein CcmD [Albidovulum sp.]MDE0530845.1 heme exporter protein CcmD [Albidovulum sp.]
MSLELGEYKFEVLAAYGVTILLVGGIVVVSVAASNGARRKLENLRRLEKRND